MGLWTCYVYFNMCFLLYVLDVQLLPSLLEIEVSSLSRQSRCLFVTNKKNGSRYHSTIFYYSIKFITLIKVSFSSVDVVMVCFFFLKRFCYHWMALMMTKFDCNQRLSKFHLNCRSLFKSKTASFKNSVALFSK